MPSRRDFIKAGGLSIVASGFAGRVLGASPRKIPGELKNMVEGVKPLTPADLAARREKARHWMREYDLDALFLTGSVNLRYFTGVNWGRSERTFGVVLKRDGDPVWVCPAFEMERAKERIPEGDAIRTWEEHENPYRLIGGVMKEAGLRRLGLGPTVRQFVAHGLKRDASFLELDDGAAVTEGCRMVKTEKELAFMDLANRITKMAYREGFKHLHSGMTSGELAGQVRDAHSRMGVSGGGWPSFGLNSAYPHGSMVRRDLEEGGIVLIDGGCSVEGFRSDVTRTVVLGKASDRQRKVWDIVRQAQTAAQEACRPGVACEDLDRTARKVIEDAGFGPDYKYFAHRLGHGIGMEGHEATYLVRGNTRKLVPGMTFSNEPGIYIYGEFGVRIEDCFVVTEDGARFLGGMEATAIDRPFGKG